MWVPILGFEGFYQVNELGEVKSIRKEIILKSYINRYGYEKVILTIHQKSSHRSVHRVVAEVFITNPESKLEVNHKDGNKLNNRVENLEWVTRKENFMHAVKMGLNKVVKLKK